MKTARFLIVIVVLLITSSGKMKINKIGWTLQDLLSLFNFLSIKASQVKLFIITEYTAIKIDFLSGFNSLCRFVYGL
jgi:hypothetical protein